MGILHNFGQYKLSLEFMAQLTGNDVLYSSGTVNRKDWIYGAITVTSWKKSVRIWTNKRKWKVAEEEGSTGKGKKNPSLNDI